ncbi:NADH-quinone oxidoreductase subunit L [Leptolinea tardivitalis]|uniref:NADH-quinone oxidoreductase subunit 5 family protein n=1 Tax=Leptolinea tardivitalis TaxID=229920 RepID=UPI000785F4E5|nr:NADH-quinone oxidoreductase subunit L [Leptolinea tardivitalis]GAP22424.1 NADH dehydrogenase subunit L [Leptolinea tardivitalis]
MASTLLLLTIGIPWAGAVIIWLIGDEYQKLLHGIAVAFSVAAGVAALMLIPYATGTPIISVDTGPVFGVFTFAPDGLGVFLAAVATVIGSLAVIFSVDYMKGEDQIARYYAFVLFFIGSMAGLVMTTNLLLVFVFWEITALCSYALISFHNDDPKAVAGGMKALIITQFGGVGLLLGALLIHSYLGSYELNDLLARWNDIPAGVLSVAAFGFLAAAAAKSAQFPFQTWLPDAMEAPTPISALIHAATMVNAGVYLLARFYPAFCNVPGWKTAVVIVGVFSALLAAIMAVVATDLKRVLAYSTVSQLGYMVYAVGTGGIFASQFHLFSHSVFKALLFLGAGAVIHAAGTRDMREMGGLGKKMPVVRNVFILGSLALAGLPIMNGFWSKELVLESGLAGGPMWAYIAMLIGAGITAFYTFRCVYLVFYGEPRKELHVHDAGPFMKTALIPLAALSLVTWLAAGPFSLLLKNTLPYHELEAVSTMFVVEEVLKAPATWIAMVVIALGLIAWWQRDKLTGLGKSLKGLGDIAADSFGFEAINRGVVAGVQSTAESLRATQTGVLNWNVASILIGLIVVMVILVMGA